MAKAGFLVNGLAELKQPFTRLFLSLFLFTGLLGFEASGSGNLWSVLGTPVANALASSPKVMVLDFQLNDMTDLPNAPEEIARINHLTHVYKQKLAEHGLQILPANDKLKAAIKNQSATYLFDNVETAATLAADSDADYLLIGVALKPTYLFVYPRILLVDINTKKVVLAKAAQLESAWTDQTTTARTAEKLAGMVKDFFRPQ